MPLRNSLAALALAALFTQFAISAPAEPAVPASAPSVRADAAVAASAVVRRTFGAAVASRITFAPLPALESGLDAYEYEAKGGRLAVRGTSPVAMARGAYDYLKSHGLGMATRSGVRFDAVRAWPDSPVVRVETPFRFRHHYNVVSFGYQVPYLGWAEWERELDWLALHGYDMPMAPVATEAIAERVWKKLGLTQAEIDAFSVGPAHLPWFRMGNIRNVDAPLPPEWHRDQVALQHRLLGRMRELGMKPVIQSFAGFVPDAVRRIEPGVALHDTNWNGGFGPDRRPRSIMPDTALFAKITKLYMEEWMREFGREKYWLVDSFNEMELPKTGKTPAEMLAGYGAETIRAIRAANPDAVWVIQGWMFGYQRHIWNKETVKALLSGVPDDAMLILDYANDYATNWPEFSGFHGKPWVYGFVPNMGGKTAYTGRLDLYARRAAEMLKSPKRGNIAGFCASGEGMDNNEALYELLADVPWSRDAAVDLDRWIPAYSVAKYGAHPEAMADAWKLLRKSCYGSFRDHPQFSWQTLSRGNGSVNRSPEFFEGAQKFLSCAPQLKPSPLYRADALELAALALGLKAEDWFVAAERAVNLGDVRTGDAAMARATELLLEADRLLESHPLHRLARWTDMARAHGETPALKAYYESNARRIITTWGPPVNDYACKVWSGLIRDFYAPRMKARYDGVKSGKGFARGPWEEAWVKSTAGISPCAAYPDPVDAAVKLVARACAEKVPVVAEPKYEALGEWAPATLGADWTDLDFTITREQARKLKGVRFAYSGGSHALDIRKVTLLADGHAVASDAHEGIAGKPSQREIYRLTLPSGATTNNSCVLRVSVRGKGGADSRGAVQLVTE